MTSPAAWLNGPPPFCATCLTTYVRVPTDYTCGIFCADEKPRPPKPVFQQTPTRAPWLRVGAS